MAVLHSLQRLTHIAPKAEGYPHTSVLAGCKYSEDHSKDESAAATDVEKLKRFHWGGGGGANSCQSISTGLPWDVPMRMAFGPATSLQHSVPHVKGVPSDRGLEEHQQFHRHHQMVSMTL